MKCDRLFPAAAANKEPACTVKNTAPMRAGRTACRTCRWGQPCSARTPLARSTSGASAPRSHSSSSSHRRNLQSGGRRLEAHPELDAQSMSRMLKLRHRLEAAAQSPKLCLHVCVYSLHFVGQQGKDLPVPAAAALLLRGGTCCTATRPQGRTW